jgi:hypothetical protein
VNSPCNRSKRSRCLAGRLRMLGDDVLTNRSCSTASVNMNPMNRFGFD